MTVMAAICDRGVRMNRSGRRHQFSRRLHQPAAIPQEKAESAWVARMYSLGWGSRLLAIGGHNRGAIGGVVVEMVELGDEGEDPDFVLAGREEAAPATGLAISPSVEKAAAAVEPAPGEPEELVTESAPAVGQVPTAEPVSGLELDQAAGEETV
jgi:hypothetical protein